MYCRSISVQKTSNTVRNELRLWHLDVERLVLLETQFHVKIGIRPGASV